MRTLLLFCCLFCTITAGYTQKLSKNIVIKDVNSKNVKLEALLSDSVTVFVFWATWCKPCQKELEALKEQVNDWKGQVTICAVSIDDSRASAKLRALSKSKKWPFPVYHDVNKQLYNLLNIVSVPFAAIVKNNEVVWTHSGYLIGDEKELINKAIELKQK